MTTKLPSLGHGDSALEPLSEGRAPSKAGAYDSSVINKAHYKKRMVD